MFTFTLRSLTFSASAAHAATFSGAGAAAWLAASEAMTAAAATGDHVAVDVARDGEHVEVLGEYRPDLGRFVFSRP